MQITFDTDISWDFDSSAMIVWARQGDRRIRCDVSQEAINELPRFRYASSIDMQRERAAIADCVKPLLERKIENEEIEEVDGTPAVHVFARHIALR